MLYFKSIIKNLNLKFKKLIYYYINKAIYIPNMKNIICLILCILLINININIKK